jgi:hypothetical protein
MPALQYGSFMDSDDVRPNLGPAADADVVDPASLRPSTWPLDLGTPITERILHGLPGPRWMLIAFWATAVLATPFVLIGAKRIAGHPTEYSVVAELASQAVLSYVVALLLWGVARLVDRATALGPDVERLTHQVVPRDESARPWDVVGPVALSAITVLVVSWGSWNANGVLSTLAVLPLLAFTTLPVMGFVWTYFRLLIGLDQLGRARLALEPFPQDGSLGLGSVGSLAFSGLALLAAAAVPTLLATTRNPTTFAVAALTLGVSIPIFFMSMWRLHRQMSSAKDRYVNGARALYAAAYEPLRTAPNLSVLRAQAPVLDAARALEERAQRIQVWPINDGLVAILGFIVAGVTSGVVVRFIVVATHI